METFKRLRQAPAGESVPIVFMTAKAQEADIEALLELGAVDVLTKPFDPMTLHEEIERIWRKAS